MKKNNIIISVLLSIFLILSLTGCPGTVEDSVDDTNPVIPDEPQQNPPEGNDGNGNDNGGNGGSGTTVYTITFDSDGGTEVPSQTFKYGEFPTEPEEPVKEGYHFAGWYEIKDDGSLDTSRYDFSYLEYHNIKLKAVWYLSYSLKTGFNINNIFVNWIYALDAKHFSKAENAPEKAKYYLDLADKDVPVWYDNEAETIYYYIPEGKKLILNEDSSNMFERYFHSLVSIDTSDFDTSNVTDMSEMFYGCNSLESIDLSTFNTSKVTDMTSMFENCYALEILDLSSFNTSNVTNMTSMISMNKMYTKNGVTRSKLKRIIFGDNFITSKVTSMRCMFEECVSLESIDLSGFDTSNVTDMSYMFRACNSLTKLDLSSCFNTSNVTDMTSMFEDCYALEILDLSSFNTSNVTDMTRMFKECLALESLDLSSFNTSNVTDMTKMFNLDNSNEAQSKLKTITFGDNFNTSKVTSMYGMFYGCSSLESIDLSGFDTSNVTDMSYMFRACNSLTKLDLSSFNTSNVINMGGIFYMCDRHRIGGTTYEFYSKLKTIRFGDGFDTSKVTDMASMFNNNTALTTVDLSGFNTSNVTDMSYMFSNCTALTQINGLENFDTGKVTDMGRMFENCKVLTELNISNFNTENVTNMRYMFDECRKVKELNFGENFKTEKVTNMKGMFSCCDTLTSLDLSNFTVNDGVNVCEMFYGSDNLITIWTKADADWTNAQCDGTIFASCWALEGSAGTKYVSYSSDKDGIKYAHVDGGESNPGYFTAKTN